MEENWKRANSRKIRIGHITSCRKWTFGLEQGRKLFCSQMLFEGTIGQKCYLIATFQHKKNEIPASDQITSIVRRWMEMPSILRWHKLHLNAEKSNFLITLKVYWTQWNLKRLMKRNETIWIGIFARWHTERWKIIGVELYSPFFSKCSCEYRIQYPIRKSNGFFLFFLLSSYFRYLLVVNFLEISKCSIWRCDWPQ